MVGEVPKRGATGLVQVPLFWKCSHLRALPIVKHVAKVIMNSKYPRGMRRRVMGDLATTYPEVWEGSYSLKVHSHLVLETLVLSPLTPC